MNERERKQKRAEAKALVARLAVAQTAKTPVTITGIGTGTVLSVGEHLSGVYFGASGRFMEFRNELIILEGRLE